VFIAEQKDLLGAKEMKSTDVYHALLRHF